MFSPEEKSTIAIAVSRLLLSLNHPEMPKSSPKFILHVDGAESWSWANIVNNDNREKKIPLNLDRNLSAIKKNLNEGV